MSHFTLSLSNDKYIVDVCDICEVGSSFSTIKLSSTTLDLYSDVYLGMQNVVERDDVCVLELVKLQSASIEECECAYCILSFGSSWFMFNTQIKCNMSDLIEGEFCETSF